MNITTRPPSEAEQARFNRWREQLRREVDLSERHCVVEERYVQPPVECRWCDPIDCPAGCLKSWQIRP